MNNFTSKLLGSLFQNDNALDELIRNEIETGINDILKAELTGLLQYDRYEHTINKNDNYRNGYYQRTLNTKYGELHINVPRDRKGEFDSPLVPKYERRDCNTEELVMKLFQTGMTNGEIAIIVEALYEKKYSKQTITNITNELIANVDAFKQRAISDQFAVIYLDATYLSIRRDTVAKEAIHIALGIKTDGTKEVLGYALAPQESAEIWNELLTDLRHRGLDKCSLFVTDGFSGIEEVISKNFPQGKIQRCLVHIQRNIKAQVRVKDQTEVANDFKRVYNLRTKEEAEIELHSFINKWGSKYPKVKGIIERNSNLLTFLDFPIEIRASIYTTNIIEGFNKNIKRKTKKKEQFPNAESLEKYLVCIFEEYNMKFQQRIHKGFGLISSEVWN